MNAIGVIYPLFWLQHEVKHMFMAQFSILKVDYYFGKHIGLKQLFIPPLLDGTLLVQESSFFKLTMFANCHVAMSPPLDSNP